MADFTDKEINEIKELLESRDKENYFVNESFHTVWFQAESSEAELRVAFLGNIQLIISRICVSNKRHGVATEILKKLIEICTNQDVHRIIMQSVLTPECAAFCEKNGFKPDPNASFEADGFITGDWVLTI